MQQAIIMVALQSMTFFMRRLSIVIKKQALF